MAITINGATTIKGNTVVGFTPASLFAAGEQGVWYDPSDFSTMFQDTAGTTPVTAVGQSVALIRDKSGRGNHATQSTAASMPTIQQDANGCYYLSFDGSNDFLTAGDVCDLLTTDLTGHAGVKIVGSEAAVYGKTIYGIATGRYSMYVSGGIYTAGYANASGVQNADVVSTVPTAQVLTQRLFRSAGQNSLYRNGSQLAITSFTAESTSYNTAYRLLIGAYSNSGDSGQQFYLNGNIYGVVLRLAKSSTGEIAATENWLNAKTKAY